MSREICKNCGLIKLPRGQSYTIKKYCKCWLKEKMQFPEDIMKEDMEKLSFVNWDRFIVNIKEKKIDLYGWIKREDSHEDFVIITYEQTFSKKWKTSYGTSSKKYDKKIFKLLECEGEEPFVCQRVEDNFNIKNCIKLEKEK